MENTLDRRVVKWLYLGIILISLMVLVGGITRLTQSGLSMVEWKPVVGMIPPLSENEWQNEFELYKQTPEFKLNNSHFSLREYKSIFFWEYVHRLIGRVIGLVFFLPGIFFWLKKKFNRRMKIKIILIFVGGLFQGFLGWYMVKSGLIKDPHVSHFRLAAHLMAALFLIVFIYWTILDYKYKSQAIKSKIISNYILFSLFVLVIIQIFYGALVAGLKAGKVYNYFPKMGDEWLPLDFYNSFDKQGLKALLESQSAVQFVHRVIGILIFFLSVALIWKVRTLPLGKKTVFLVVSSVIFIQVILGVLTLVFSVPIFLGVLHQSIAIIILLVLINAIYKNNYKCLN